MKCVREGYKMTELGEIPWEWDIENLSSICTKIFVGIATSTSDYYTENGVNIIRNQNIKNDRLCEKEMLMITEEFSNKNESKKLKQGDVITVRTGYPGITCVVPKEYEGAHTFTTLISRPDNRIVNSYYLSRYMNSEFGINFFNSGKAGGAQQNLNVKVLETMPIILPTIKEQEKIALIFSTVDEQIDNVDALIEKNKELKKGLMQTLFTKGIGHTKFKRTEIGEIPEEWGVLSLIEISKKIGDGLHGTPKYDENGEYYFINGNNLIGGNIKITQDTKRVSKEEYIKNNKELNKNSLLISLNGTIGNIAYYNNERIMLSKSSGYITLNDKCNKTYIYQLLQSSRISEYFNKELTGTTIKNLSLNTLRNTPIAIPNIKEQEKIASILSEVDEKLDECANKKQKLEEIKKGLMQQLLTGKIKTI